MSDDSFSNQVPNKQTQEKKIFGNGDQYNGCDHNLIRFVLFPGNKTALRQRRIQNKKPAKSTPLNILLNGTLRMKRCFDAEFSKDWRMKKEWRAVSILNLWKISGRRWFVLSMSFLSTNLLICTWFVTKGKLISTSKVNCYPQQLGINEVSLQLYINAWMPWEILIEDSSRQNNSSNEIHE